MRGQSHYQLCACACIVRVIYRNDVLGMKYCWTDIKTHSKALQTSLFILRYTSIVSYTILHLAEIHTYRRDPEIFAFSQSYLN